MFEKIAYAAGETQGGPQVNPLLQFLPLIIIFVFFYLLLIRPQQKKHRELQKMIVALKKGDRIITAGGMIGTITSIQDDYVVIKTADSEGSKMEILKSGITGLRG